MRAVAALCATIITKHDPATGTSSLHLVPTHIGQAQMRQAAGHRPDDGDAVRRKVPGRTGRNRACNGDQRAGESRRKPAESEDACHHYGGQGPATAGSLAGSWRKT